MPAAAAGEQPAGGARPQRASRQPRGPADARKGGVQDDRKWVLNIKRAGHLMSSTFTLDLLVKKGVLLDLPADQIRRLIRECTTDPHTGGEAAVHLTHWDGRDSSIAITKDTPIAIKVYCHPDFKRQELREWNEDQHRDYVEWCQGSLRQEVNILGILHDAGCDNSFPRALGIFQHPGSLRESIPPFFGYVMSAYKLGSLAEFLHRTCHRLTPDSDFASFFGPAQLAGHYSKLHKVLLRLSIAEAPPHLAGTAEADASTPQPSQVASPAAQRRGLLLQDISTNNLLLREAGKGCELVFADPSRAQLAAHLERPDAKGFFTATFLWGCMASRHGIVDETADVYSTNICMLELWGVAEGAPVPLKELATCLRVDTHVVLGVTLLRALCTGMLKRQAMGSGACGIVPRIKRELPLSWLMLWAILLGCDDFHTRQELDSGWHHRRPSVADMADVAARLEMVAAQMERLEGGMSAASLEAPAGTALVQECMQLYDRLAALTRLDDPDLLPADASLRWVATRFLQQQHPLVAAMKRQGALPLGSEDERVIDKLPRNMWSFQAAVLEAECEADWIGDEETFNRLVDAETDKLRLMCKEYRECQLEVLRLVPQDSPAARMLRSRLLPPELQPFLEGLLPLPPAATEAQPQAAGLGAEPQAAGAAVLPPAAVAQPQQQTPASPAVPVAAPLAAPLHQPGAPTAVPASHGSAAVAAQPMPTPAAAAAQSMPTPAAAAAQHGAQLPPQEAVQWSGPPSVGGLQLGQAAAGQPTQTCFGLVQHQLPLAGQAPGGLPAAFPGSPRPPAWHSSMSPAAPAGTWPAQHSLSSGLGTIPSMNPCAAAPGALPAAGWTSTGAHTQRAAGVAALEASPGGQAQARAANVGRAPAVQRKCMEDSMSLDRLEPLPEAPANVAEAAQPFQPRTAAAAPQPAHATVPAVAAPVEPAAQPAGAPAVPAVPVQQLYAVPPPPPADAPLPSPAAALLPASVLAQQLGAHLLQQAPQPAAPRPLTASQLGQAAAGQPAANGQPFGMLLPQQLPLDAQPSGLPPILPSSPGLLAASPALAAALGGPFHLDMSAAFGFGYSSRQEVPPGMFSQASPAGGGTWQAGTAGAAGTAAAGVASQGQQQPAAAVAAAAMPRQPGSPPKKPRLGSYSSRAATAPPASPATPAQPKPRAFCDLFAAPGPAAGGQPAPPLAPTPHEWLRLLRERGQLDAAGELGRLAAGGPSSPAAAAASSAAASSAAGSSVAASGSLLLSSKGQRMALTLAGGLRLQPDPDRNYKKADVERYADALERLLTSQLPPAGLEAQHALFRPIDTAAKLAWFLGWWASKERKAPGIPGLDASVPKAMECSNNAKAAWTRAVLDAAADGGKFGGEVDAAYRYTMAYVAQALLLRLLLGRPLFAAAVAEEMQKM